MATQREVAREFLAIGPALRALIDSTLRGLDEPVSLLRYRILARLDQGGCGNADLAHAAEVSAATVSPVVDDLVRAGWVERSSHPTDRRAVRLSLTPAGRRKLETWRAALEDAFAELLGRVPRADRDALHRGLVALRASFESRAPVRPGHRR